jgi:hypothetical protein
LSSAETGVFDAAAGFVAAQRGHGELAINVKRERTRSEYVTCLVIWASKMLRMGPN